MNKKKIVSSILAGLSLCLFMGVTTSATENNLSSGNNPSYCNYVDIKDIDGFENIDILGTKYDLSLINPGVVQAVIRTFDEINSGNLSKEKKDERLKSVKEILDDYVKDPKKYENFPVTLDLGPSSLLREEIRYVQNKIEGLKGEQESIKNTKMEKKAIEQKVKELQGEIDKLSKWINYSVVNFKTSQYKTTFCDPFNSTPNVEDVSVLLSCVYSTGDYSKLFRISVKSDGKFEIQGDKVSDSELSDAVKRSLEFENFKVRDLLEKIKAVESLKLPKEEQDKQIKALKREIESSKAYGLSHEIVLLNLEKDAIERTKASSEYIKSKVNEINKKIDDKVKSLKDFKENFESNLDYVTKNSDVGKTPSYFGYVLQDGKGFGLKVSLDENNKVLVDNIKVADKDKVTLDILNSEQKTILKKLLQENISKTKEEISKLEGRKASLKDKNDDTKYHLTDAIDKQISVLNNDVKNYEIILSQV